MILKLPLSLLNVSAAAKMTLRHSLLAMPSLTNDWKPQSTGEPVRTRIAEAMVQVAGSEPESFDHDHD